MHDRVADVLAQREALDRGAGVAIALSLVLHGALTALTVYAALHAPAPRPAPMVNIQFAKMPAAAAPVTKPAAKPVEAPKIEDVKPKIEEPKPEPKPEEPKKPEKNTVPFSPFGRSTKKGAEEPAAEPPKPAPAPEGGAAVPIGGAGVTGIEGGDFPHTLYLEGMHRRIGRNWFRGNPPPGVEAVVYFRILRDGTITESRIHESSGNGTFDRGALSAVRASSPLNPLPFAYNGTYLGVYLTFK